MQLLPLAIPPGVFRNGTEYQSKGRWYDQNLTRWRGQQLAPIGGWRSRSASQVAVTGVARAILPWRTTTSNRWIAIGTNSNLYVQNPSGTNFDITPAGFVAGGANETANTGYGAGAYGVGTYGTPRPDTGDPIPVAVWDLDNFGNYLVGCCSTDGGIYQWELDTGAAAAILSAAPTSCAGVVVTQESFVMAIGAGGDPRKVQWSDQGASNTWTPTTTNQAGDTDFVTSGTLIKAARLGPVVLFLTSSDAHMGQYVGLPSVYQFQPIAYGCGAISKGCLIPMGSQAAWWSISGPWMFDGQSARTIPCDVLDYVQLNMNPSQRSKVTGFHNSAFGEVWWFYPSASSTENDSYVFWDYRKSQDLGSPVWGVGSLARLCAVEQSVFATPLAMGSDGICYEHETGYAYDGVSPYGESGPIELGAGTNLMNVQGIIPDEATAGQVTVLFKTKPYPNAAETTLGTTSFGAAGRADLRFSSRQAKLRVTGAAASDWRFGQPRLEISAGGAR